MSNNYQGRIFLNLLDRNNENELIIGILKSPLGLASELIKLLFEDDFDKLKDDLDGIKSFAAGVGRAEKLSADSKYSLALYYPNMFAFHQFFNSSYRARQGKVLEKMLMNIIKNYTKCDIVPEKTKDMLKLLDEIIGSKLPVLDMDVFGYDTSNKKTLIMQLRSRDDTGGTTAKGSLVDLLRAMLRTGNTPSHDILYLVCVWDARDLQQKRSTIGKMYSSLRDLIDIDYNEFENNVSGGVLLKNNLTLKLAYGTKEIADALFMWTGSNDESILGSISKIVSYTMNWDDLWIAYAIANLELEVSSLYGYSNVKILEEKYKTIDTKFDFSSYQNLVKSIDTITNELVAIWDENSIPLESLADKAHYIRDLLFLRASYEKGL